MTNFCLKFAIFLILGIFPNGPVCAEEKLVHDKTEAKSVYDISLQKMNYSLAYWKKYTASMDIERKHLESIAQHQRKLMLNEEDAYDTQAWMTKAIFGIVTLMVVCGIIMSFMQFMSDIERKRKEPSEQTKIKISKDGLEISSSVIGLLVLFMSFMFFYLYIKDVYAIKINKVEPIRFSNLSTAKHLGK